MNRFWLICISAALTLSVADFSDARGQRACSGEKETLECLKENFSEVYENQYFQFLIIIGKAQKEAVSCNSVEATAAYLNIASKIGDNLEVEEGLKDVLETKFLKNSPECFLDALLKTDNNVKEIILGNYLQKPIDIKKEEVDSIISRYVEQERYKEMLKPYFHK